MSGGDHARYSEDLGAYLLGALPEIESEVVERHVISCAECRAELERLRPAADALGHSVEPHEPPPSLKRSLMAAVESDLGPGAPGQAAPRERRPRRLPRLLAERPRMALVGALAVLVVGLAVGVGVDRLTRGNGAAHRALVARVDPRALPGGSAELDVRGTGPATLRVRGLPMLRGGRVYEVWLERGRSTEPAGALFAVSRDGRGAAAIPGGLAGVDRVLVTRERAGGARRPTEPPVISVRT